MEYKELTLFLPETTQAIGIVYVNKIQVDNQDYNSMDSVCITPDVDGYNLLNHKPLYWDKEKEEWYEQEEKVND